MLVRMVCGGGGDGGALYTARVREGCDEFVELSPLLPAQEIAHQIRTRRVDVIVDLVGFKTSGGSMHVLAALQSGSRASRRGHGHDDAGYLRPPPLSVHMLETTNLYGSGVGFGAPPFLHFFAGDRVVAPPEHERVRGAAGRGRGENLLLLPYLFWGNATGWNKVACGGDSALVAGQHGHGSEMRRIGNASDKGQNSTDAERRRHGLPAASHALVLGAFNRGDKIRPDTFDAWCQILKRCSAMGVPTVLWVLAGDQKGELATNLRREAAARGASFACRDRCHAARDAHQRRLLR